MAFGLDDLFGAGVGLVGGLVNNLFAGSRQEDAQAFSGMSQLQSQAYNQQEAQKAREFNAGQASLQRDWADQTTYNMKMFNMSEAQRARDFNRDEAVTARDFNREEAATARAFNAGEADKSRSWTADQVTKAQEYATLMSNTQYQRGVEDMKKAGINPMLAYMRGGASAPTVNPGSSSMASGGAASAGAASGPSASSGSAGGSSASGPSASSGAAHGQMAQVFDLIQPAISTARAAQELANMRANERLTDQQTRTDGVRAGAIAEQAGLSNAETRRLTKLMPSFEAEGAYGKTRTEFHESQLGRMLDLAGLGGGRLSETLKPIFGGAGAASNFVRPYRY